MPSAPRLFARVRAVLLMSPSHADRRRAEPARMGGWWPKMNRRHILLIYDAAMERFSSTAEGAPSRGLPGMAERTITVGLGSRSCG